MRKSFIALVTIVVASQSLYAQINLQQYTPSILLNKGQTELKIFNNLYTQTAFRNSQGDKVEDIIRSSFLNNQLRFTHGVSSEKRLNIGFETNYRTVAYSERSKGAFNVLGGESISKQSLFTSIGPTIRFTPIGNIGNFSIQSPFLFPLNGDELESPRFVDWNRYTWWTQIFYDYSITSKLNLLLELDLLARFKKESNQNSFYDIPASMFLSYFLTNKFTVYANVQHTPRYGKSEFTSDANFGRLQWITQLGAGAKYLIAPFLEVELSYGNFVLSRGSLNYEAGAGQSFNFGIRIIR